MDQYFDQEHDQNIISDQNNFACIGYGFRFFNG